MTRIHFLSLVGAMVLLGLAGDRFAALADEPPPAPDGSVDPETSKAKIRAALERKVSLEAVETPLREVVSFLAEKGKVTIYLDEKALREVGIETAIPVTKRLKNIPLKSILRLMLKEMELVYTIRDDAILITTEDEANAELLTRIYSVEDLVGKESSPGMSRRMDRLIDTITSTIVQRTWDSVGGAGSIDAVGSTLVVCQTEDIQEEVAALLTMLRQAKASYDKWDGKTRPIPDLPADFAFHPRGSFEAAWEKARRQPIAVKFSETPLRDVVDSLEKLSGLNIEIDEKALKDFGIEGITPVTFQCRDLPLESALRRITHELELMAVPRDDTLLITTPDEANAQLETWVFPVFDLVSGEVHPDIFGGEPPFQSAAELERSVLAAVDPRTWDKVGGPGSIQYYPPSGALVVSQTHAGMQRLGELLKKLRVVRPIATKRDPAAADSQIVSRVHGPFHIHRNSDAKGTAPANPSAEEVRRAIVEWIEPESWNQKNGPAKVVIVGDRLLVRHEAQVQERIERLIQKILFPGQIHWDPPAVPPRKPAFDFPMVPSFAPPEPPVDPSTPPPAKPVDRKAPIDPFAPAPVNPVK